MRSVRRAGVVPFVIVLALASALVAAPLTAAPGDRTTRLISSGGSGAFVSDFAGASSDGSRVWFTTAEPNPSLGDTDTAPDVYERSADGALRLISLDGPAPGSTGFAGATPDGSRVWFTTRADSALLGDSDTSNDVYERSADGGLRLISPAGAAAFAARFEGASDDGSRVWFATDEPNGALGDIDAANDVYERRSDGTLRLVSIGGNVNADAFVTFGSRDGSRVWFHTTQAFLGDTDAAYDLYERRADDSLRLVSPAGSASSDAFYVHASPNGDRVLFVTSEPIGPLGDADTTDDIYERRADGTLRLISAAGSGPYPAVFRGATRDAGRVWFTTSEPDVSLGDTDTTDDVYERTADGSLRLVSTGGPGAFNARFLGASADGSRVWFITREPNAGLGDTDTVDDVYERGPGGALRLISTPGSGAFPVSAAPEEPGGSRDGSRVWFTTAEPNASLGDTGAQFDVYERTLDDSVRLISGAGSAGAEFVGASEDGSRVWYRTGSPRPDLGDTDAAADVFEVRWGTPGNVVAPSVSGDARPGGTLVCAPGRWAGDGFSLTTQWLRDGAALAGRTADTYAATAADIGASLSCRVTATNVVGATSATSAPLSVGAAAVRPRVLRRVAVTGPLVLGTRLACDRSRISGATTVSVTWRRGSRTIGRGPRLRILRRDLGRPVACRVVASNSAGAVTSTSRAVRVPRRCVVPPLRGATPAAARARLGRAGCRVRVLRSPGSGVRRGSLLRTRPDSGARGPNGRTVTLVVRR